MFTKIFFCNDYNDKNVIPWLIFIIAFLFLVVQNFFTKGMFYDGVTYADIARNLSQNIGSFWSPIYITRNFYDHPMLAPYLESLLFRLLGDSYIVEKLYSLITAFVSIWCIKLIWDICVSSNKEYKKFLWLPLILWISLGDIYWVYQNNMLESTLAIFCMLSVFFTLKGMIVDKYIWLNCFISACCIFLAILTKGPVGLFPLGAPFLYWIIYHKKITFKKMFLITLFYVFIVALLFCLFIFFNHNAIIFWQNYFQGQLTRSLTIKMGHKLPTLIERLYIVKVLIFNILLQIISFAGIIFVIVKKKNLYVNTKEYIQNALLFFLIGLSGSLPIAISFTQSDFYLVPCEPFFVLGVSLFVLPSLYNLFKYSSMQNKFLEYLKYFLMVLVLIGIILPFTKIGKISRDKDLLVDLYKFENIIPRKAEIGVSDDMVTDWRLHAYLMRIFQAKLRSQNTESKYVLLKNNYTKVLNPNLKKVKIETKNYVLYM
jgi:hypothetical protein